MARNCNGWCWPAVIYVTLAVLSLLITLLQDLSHLGEQEGRFRVSIIVFHVIMMAFWTWLLYWLCSNCQNVAAWIVLFLPVFMGLVAIVMGTVAISAWMVGKGVETGVTTAAHAGKAVGQAAGHAAGHVVGAEGFDYEDY